MQQKNIYIFFKFRSNWYNFINRWIYFYLLLIDAFYSKIECLFIA